MSAGRLRVAIGETILPLAGCGDGVPQGTVRILRLSDGNAELAYGFSDVIDIVSLGDVMAPAPAPGEVCGVTLLAGEQVEILDPFWLFEAHCVSAQSPAARPVCAMALGDSWMNNFLRPIVEAAGYAVVDATAGARFDILVAAADAPVPVGSPAAVIRIRETADAGAEDGSIYRYDRAALLSALGARAASSRKAR